MSFIQIQPDYQYGFKDTEAHIFKTPKGLSRAIVEMISRYKNEPQWMLEYRLHAYDVFCKKKMPHWGADLSGINFDEMYYYLKPTERSTQEWSDLPKDIKKTFDRLGIPQMEQDFLAGVGAQYDSEVVYHNMRKELVDLGVVFSDVETAMREHPDLVKQYFGTVIPSGDNKFAALNSAVWSGGSFVYVPPGVQVNTPLQAYFRINAQNMGQFERTLIIADEGSFVHYVEGCTAPIYQSASLHSAVVEIIVLRGARVRYTTVQNWSKNVYNLVTKRAVAYEDATMEWVDGNFGSRVTMKYPSVYLMGKGARADILSLAMAGEGQHQDAGGKVVHVAPLTTSHIVSKSISHHGGRTSYRGLLKIHPEAYGVKSNVQCDALILDEASRSDTYPVMEIDNDDVSIGHEATVSKIGTEQLFYLQSRGLSPQEASLMMVNGFIEPIVKELPLEYAVEMNRLIELEMEGSVG
ncbi:MAG: FeS assembly protein SufB [Parcubacteria group bacterium GW2011_GWA2_43_13]|nr:MAG: FeS assembly protein SufB [Parcubacteria group bacterium GW2011_GWA2_43_13]OGY68564.1 MAG: Fe-S cluster assembly protein SufB [Candidatus Jacksonbacteria bacterium RIFCSPHIGHO2_02_FULL_43_10]OGY70560.1 MAG: Fe-S cluster assembly protein SufB [Candidatus Jacksonbacteria bacterium RIFCSPLOWO2_01_FULL_44_13]HAZ16336.1 Fe-S cluster assembly protein SufB [Candidatus Jacksonbacteria bacterium]